MFNLFKGKGDHMRTDHWRGILLADVLGKKFRRIQRGWLMPFAAPAIGDLQFGGMPGRGTDMATHVIRLLQEFTTANQMSLAVLFFDCVSAFHSLVRQLLVAQPCAQSRV